MSLRERWIAAMRGATARAMGRECDYAMREGDTDRFDPIGLLAKSAGDCHHGAGLHVFQSFRGEDGARVTRQAAERLAVAAGFPPERLYDLCLMNDGGATWGEMADYVEAQ
jgi:hypothetical protein